VAPQPTANSPRHEGGGILRYPIWQKPLQLAAYTRDRLVHAMRCSEAIARPFRAPVSGQIIEGAFYVAGTDTPKGRDIIVSVCTDKSGRLGDIGKTRLASTVAKVRLRRKSQIDHRIWRVPFSVRCQVVGNRRYWLVLEPAWREPLRLSVPPGPSEYVGFVVAEPPPRDTVLRVHHRWGIGAGNYTDSIRLVAELDLLAGGSKP